MTRSQSKDNTPRSDENKSDLIDFESPVVAQKLSIETLIKLIPNFEGKEGDIQDIGF